MRIVGALAVGRALEDLEDLRKNLEAVQDADPDLRVAITRAIEKVAEAETILSEAL